VANFRTTNLAIPLPNLRRAMNSRLPDDIAVVSVDEAPWGFHASKSATGKTYRYRIYVAPGKPVALARQVWLYRGKPLDIDAMRDAAGRLLGRHDFRGLASSAEVRQNTVRKIRCCDVGDAGPEIHVTVEGDGFLYNMVRNVVGTLVEIGRGLWTPDRIDEILDRRDRRLAGPTAPPEGLCLVSVHYDNALR
jgi:tRNA pseudouridine38-40 synthase